MVTRVCWFVCNARCAFSKNQYFTSGGSSYGRTGRPPPPIDQNLGLIMATPLRHGGKFSLKPLLLATFCIKMYKKLSASGGLSLRLCPWTPLGAPTQTPV